MKAVLLAAAAAVLTVAAGPAAAQMGGDAAAGEKVFKKCMACHRVGPDAKNLVGPILTGVVGRPAGTVEGYKYSEINQAAGSAGLVWTEENIFNYLPDPQGFLKGFLDKAGKADMAKGQTKMVYKLASEQERKDVIAYLASVK